MRQTAPLSPAIHLGAQRLLIIGAGRMHEPAGRVADEGYPSLAQIAGHAMASIFLDALAVDIERMQRINRTLALLPDHVPGRTRRCGRWNRW
jgi:NTE family protein